MDRVWTPLGCKSTLSTDEPSLNSPCFLVERVLVTGVSHCKTVTVVINYLRLEGGFPDIILLLPKGPTQCELWSEWVLVKPCLIDRVRGCHSWYSFPVFVSIQNLVFSPLSFLDPKILPTGTHYLHLSGGPVRPSLRLRNPTPLTNHHSYLFFSPHLLHFHWNPVIQRYSLS